MSHRFVAKMDNLSRMVTVAVLVVLIIPFITIGQQVAQSHSLLLLIVPIIIVIALGVTALLHPTAYSLDTEGLQVHRPLGSVTIPLSNIRSLEPVTMADLGFGLRTFGSGGFFGYFGKFWYKKIGHVTFYVTDRDKLILLKLADDRKIVISPDDREGFLAAFREMM